MARLYDDELRSINRKSRQVYLKYGVIPFISDMGKVNRSLKKNSLHLPGFQIERLYPKIYED